MFPCSITIASVEETKNIHFHKHIEELVPMFLCSIHRCTRVYAKFALCILLAQALARIPVYSVTILLLAFLTMPKREETIHPKGFEFREERRLYLLRTVDKLPYSQCRLEVVNRIGGHPSKQHCVDTVKKFSVSRGQVVSKYKNCGRFAYKVAPEDRKFLIQCLLKLRRKCICTSSVLQRELARERNVTISLSYIRKILNDKGYYWLSRSKKPKYSPADKLLRLGFSEIVIDMSEEELLQYLALCLDGVVLTTPPEDTHQRQNYCRQGETHLFRKTSEAACEELQGCLGKYASQVPKHRQVPLWGGIGPGGFAVVLWHPDRKVDSEEWVTYAVESGKLVAACKRARPDRTRGPWHVIADNESFLKKSAPAHRRVNVNLWHIPPRSPDLNPVEKFWSWLRRKLRAMDLADLMARRPPVGKTELKARVRALTSTDECKRVAHNCVKGLRKVCLEVRHNKGGASRA